MTRDFKDLGPSEFTRGREKRRNGGKGGSLNGKGGKGGGSFIASFFKLLIFLLLICGVLSFMFLGLPRIKAKLFRSEYFRLEKVDIVGVERADRKEIVRAVGVEAGGSVLKTDLAAIRDRVREVSWVREAEVIRELPARLIIRVKEHTPVGVVDTGDRFLFVDVDGETARIDESVKGYPVFTGFVDEEGIVVGAGLIEMLKRGGIVGKDSIKGVSYDETMGLSVMTRGGVLLRFGYPPFEEKAKRLSLILPDAMGRGEVEYIYLDIENSIVVKNRGL